MNRYSAEQAIKNAVASSEMEGMHPTDKDIDIISDFINGSISREELVRSVLSDMKVM